MNRIKLDFKIQYLPFALLDHINVEEYFNWIQIAKELFEKELEIFGQDSVFCKPTSEKLNPN